MYKSYLKIALRNLLNNKAYSFINISGLAIGMAVSILIGLWVFDEMNFNKSFKNHGRIYSVYHHLTFGSDIYTESGVSPRFIDEVRTNFPEFESLSLSTYQTDYIVSYKEEKFTKPGLFVEPGFVEMFSMRMIAGSNDGLTNIHSVFLSKTLADAMVGENPIGKTIKFDNRDDLTVTGVYEDFSENSEFSQIQMLLPMEYHFSRSEAGRKQRDSWDDISFQCFVILSDKTSVSEAEGKIKDLLFEKGSEHMKAMRPKGFLFSMDKWHLYADFKDGKNIGGKIKYVWMFGLIGGFVLILACINFMNLSTARSEKRSKEVGIRKVMGSVRKQLIGQFLSESLIIVCLSFSISIAIVVLSLPWFNEIADKKMILPWNNQYFIFLVLAFIIATSILAGSYPALFLSSFNPIKVLKGTFKVGRFASLPRKVMVVFQFTISIVLAIGTIVVFQQIQHAKDRPVGFDREGIIQLQIQTENLAKANYNTLRHDFLSTGVVEDMAKSDFPITGGMWTDGSLSWEGKDPSSQPLVAMNTCTHDFPKTNGFQFIEGRDFSREYATDSSAVIVNEMAAKLFSNESVVGKSIKLKGQDREIIGVIKDQIRWTPFSKQSPHIYFVGGIQKGYLTIRIGSKTGIHSALEKIQAVIKKYDAAAPFTYKFQDDDYARLFKEEERTGKLASVFSGLAIFISCLGIFGLASFTASQRTKEIGIRKVLGATIFNVWTMLSLHFLSLVVLSIVIASPIALYFSNQWLQQYEYRIVISAWIFGVTGICTLVITLLTISYQSLKAALVNPVNTLKSE